MPPSLVLAVHMILSRPSGLVVVVMLSMCISFAIACTAAAVSSEWTGNVSIRRDSKQGCAWTSRRSRARYTINISFAVSDSLFGRYSEWNQIPAYSTGDLEWESLPERAVPNCPSLDRAYERQHAPEKYLRNFEMERFGTPFPFLERSVAEYDGIYTSTTEVITGWQSSSRRWRSNSAMRTTVPSKVLIVPFLGSAGILVFLMLVCVLLIMHRLIKRRIRREQCVYCGYSMRGSPQNVCPECGRVTTSCPTVHRSCC